MQLKKNPDSSPDSLLNEPTDSLLVEPTLDSPATQEEAVPLMPELAPDTPQKQQRTLPLWVKVTFFSVLGISAALIALALIALPSLVSCSPIKAKQAEAKQNVGTMNRSQQAYFLENDAFADSLSKLGIGIKTQTVNYDYSIRTTKTAAFSYGIARKRTNNIKSYVGGVFLVPANQVAPKAPKGEKLTVAILCEAVSPGTTPPAEPTFQNGQLACAEGTRDLSGKKRQETTNRLPA